MNETVEPFCEISDVLALFRIFRRSNIKCLQQIARKLYLLRNDLQSPNFILDVIDLGYKLPFKDPMPTEYFLRNNKSVLNYPEFVGSAILQLLKDDKIEEHSSASFCVNPFSVAKGKKKSSFGFPSR